MKKISESSYFFKKIFPYIWFGFAAFFLLIVLATGAYQETPFLIVIPLIFALAGFAISKLILANLSDAVYDGGDHLEIHKDGTVDKVFLKDISNIYHESHRSLKKAVIISKAGGQLKVYNFVLPSHIGLFKQHPMIKELNERVEKAKKSANK